MFIKYSEECTLSNFGGLDLMQIKSLFHNKGEINVLSEQLKTVETIQPTNYLSFSTGQNQILFSWATIINTFRFYRKSFT